MSSVEFEASCTPLPYSMDRAEDWGRYRSRILHSIRIGEPSAAPPSPTGSGLDAPAGSLAALTRGPPSPALLHPPVPHAGVVSRQKHLRDVPPPVRRGAGVVRV